MGQKTSPIGLRLGLHRKWTTSWGVFSSVRSENRLSPHVSARGGDIRSGREERLSTLLRRRPTPLIGIVRPASSISRRRSSSVPPVSISIRKPHRLFPIDVQVRIGAAGNLFVVLFYTKILGRD